MHATEIGKTTRQYYVIRRLHMEQILSEIVISDSNRTKVDMILRITVVVINE